MSAAPRGVFQGPPLMSQATLAGLQAAYVRPCFICGAQGFCEHREPLVEAAIMQATADAAARRSV